MAIINKLPSGSAREQVKTVTAETSTITVTPDLHYLLSQVTVNPTPSEQKTRAASTSNVTVTPSSGKLLSSVTVTPTPSETKTVTASTAVQNVTPSSGKLLSKVTVNPMVTKYFPWAAAKNGSNARTLTSGTVTCESATVTVIYSLMVTRYFYDDSAQSDAMTGTLKLQGSNNNSTWTDVKTMSYTTTITDTSTNGTASGYKYYRFQFYCNPSGWGKAACACFIAYK